MTAPVFVNNYLYNLFVSGHDTSMTHLEMSRKGGKAGTKAQREARAENVRKATLARMKLRAEKKVKKSS